MIYLYRKIKGVETHTFQSSDFDKAYEFMALRYGHCWDDFYYVDEDTPGIIEFVNKYPVLTVKVNGQ